MKKRFLSMLLAIVMVVGLVPGFALTAGAETAITPTQPANGDGSAASPYEIGTAAELYWFAEQVNAGQVDDVDTTAICGKLTNNITVNASVLGADGYPISDTSGLIVWTPIGNKTYKYKGTFDGSGYTVSGLYLDLYDNSSKNIGFFGYCNNATVKNLTIKESYFAGYEYVGGIAGCFWGNSGKMENCVNYATVKGYQREGGVAGALQYASATNCHNHGLVIGTNYVGGFTGQTGYASVFTNCSNTGTVRFEHNNSGSYCGGFVAYAANGSPTFVNCYNSGSIVYYYNATRTPQYKGAIGGFVCNGNGTYTNCYSSAVLSVEKYGTMSTGDPSYSFKGFVNSTYSNFSATNCYYNSAYEDQAASGTTGKTLEQFASGEVTYLLNGSVSEGDLVWYQTLETDAVPQFEGEIVYYDAEKTEYYNISTTKYTVTWLVDGETYKTVELKAGETITLPEEPTKANEQCEEYTFAGWEGYTENMTMPEGDVTFKAQFTAETSHDFENGVCTVCKKVNAQLAGTTVSLKGALGFNFFFELDEAILANENATIRFTFPNDEGGETTAEVPVSKGVLVDPGYYVFTREVFAKQMADVFKIQVIVEIDGEEYASETYEYSVVEYCSYILNDNYADPTLTAEQITNLKALVKQMLHYGAAAQLYFGYNTDNLANAGIDG